MLDEPSRRSPEELARERRAVEERSRYGERRRHAMRRELEPLLAELCGIGVNDEAFHRSYTQSVCPFPRVAALLTDWVGRLSGPDALTMVGSGVAHRELRGSEVVDRLVDTFRERPQAQEAVAIALVAMATPAMAPALAALVQGEVAAGRRSTATARLISALGKMRGSDEARSAVRQLADAEPDPADRVSSLKWLAVAALARLDPPTAVPYLVRLSESHPDAATRSAAREELRRVRRRKWPDRAFLGTGG